MLIRENDNCEGGNRKQWETMGNNMITKLSKFVRAEKAAIDLMDKSTLSYHNTTHAILVAKAASRLCDLEGVEGKTKQIVIVAAKWHDVGNIFQRERHEETSAEMATKELHKLGWAKEDINLVKELILDGTKFYRNAQIQRPKTKLQMIMADADLSNLGLPTKDFLESAEKLREEMHVKYGLKWLESTITFLKSHNYFTESAHKLFDQNKKANIAALQAKLREIGKK